MSNALIYGILRLESLKRLLRFAQDQATDNQIFVLIRSKNNYADN